jgi:hypothetical protein
LVHITRADILLFLFFTDMHPSPVDHLIGKPQKYDPARFQIDPSNSSGSSSSSSSGGGLGAGVGPGVGNTGTASNGGAPGIGITSPNIVGAGGDSVARNVGSLDTFKYGGGSTSAPSMGSPGASGPRAARDRFKLKKKAGSSSSVNSRAFNQVEPSSDGTMYPSAFDSKKLSLDDNGGWRTKIKEDPGSSISSSSSSARKSSSSSSSSSSSNSTSNPYRSKSDQPQFDFGPTATSSYSAAPVSVKVTFELKLFSADKVGLYMKPIKATTVALGDKMAALVKQVQGHTWQSLDNWQPGSVKDGANGGGGPDGAVGVWCVPVSAHDAISSRLYTLGGPLVDITVKKVSDSHFCNFTPWTNFQDARRF